MFNVENKDFLKEVIAGCIRRERRAQEQLFKLFYGKMMGVCLRYIKDQDSAQEVLQEGFIKIFDKLEAFDYKGSFEGWMRRIMANTAIDSIRKSRRDPYLMEDDTFFHAETENVMEAREEAEKLELKAEVAMEAIQELSPAYRTVFNLFVLEEYSHREIAEMLNISEGTSKSNLAKAKANLSKIISQKLVNIKE